MIRDYLAGGALIAVIGLGGLSWWQGQTLIARKAEVEKLEADLKAAETAVKIEHRTQTVIREIHVKSSEAQADVKAAPDPECANPQPVLDAWRGGIDRLRPETGDDHSAAVSP
ncbi:MAG: hypothetical protein AAGC58_04545 [Asticcacaulis sp.]